MQLLIRESLLKIDCIQSGTPLAGKGTATACEGRNFRKTSCLSIQSEFAKCVRRRRPRDQQRCVLPPLSQMQHQFSVNKARRLNAVLGKVCGKSFWKRF